MLSAADIGHAVLMIGLGLFVIWITSFVAKQIEQIKPKPPWGNAAIVATLIGSFLIGGLLIVLVVRG